MSAAEADLAQWLINRRQSTIATFPRSRNKATAKRYASAYYQRNKPRFLLSATKRQCSERVALADLTLEQWNESLAHFGHSCAYCGSVDRLQKEHVHPVSLGGAFTRSNIVPGCISCNQSKKDKPLDQWFKFRPFYSDERLLRLIYWIFGEVGLAEVKHYAGPN